MRILITGICGFVGSALAGLIIEHKEEIHGPLEVIGLDNFSRPGSEINRQSLKRLGVKLFYGDLRNQEDLQTLPGADWVIDAAANPSVLSGVDGLTSSRQVFEHNLVSTLNLLEYCKRHNSGFVLLSTSRVYSIKSLAALPIRQENNAFHLDISRPLPHGVTENGVSEELSTEPPVSLYGASKLASESIALEYGETFDFPVWVNRCGVLAGAGQFGRPDQGIFSFWINSYLHAKPLKYIGFNGNGYQVRDCMHPADLLPVLFKQFCYSGKPSSRVFNLGGGKANAMSLSQLSSWCSTRFGLSHNITKDLRDRPFDIPWMVLDSAKASSFWQWKPQIPIQQILEEIARHAEANEAWLELSAPL